MARTQAVYYRDNTGREPVHAFLESLPVKRRAKLSEFVDEHLNDDRRTHRHPSSRSRPRSTGSCVSSEFGSRARATGCSTSARTI